MNESKLKEEGMKLVTGSWNLSQKKTVQTDWLTIVTLIIIFLLPCT